MPETPEIQPNPMQQDPIETSESAASDLGEAPAAGSVSVESVNQPAKKESPASGLFDFLEILVFAVCAALLLFTLFFRVCRVDGRSMQYTLRDGEKLIVSNLAPIEAGDIIVFHQTSEKYTRFNEALVKRVIATEGQTIRIDYNLGEVYVDGELLDEPYISLLSTTDQNIDRWTTVPSMPGFDWETRVFETTVPAGCYFVMGDNRNNSADSRSIEVGFVDTRRVLGKAIVRLSPWTTYD